MLKNNFKIRMSFQMLLYSVVILFFVFVSHDVLADRADSVEKNYYKPMDSVNDVQLTIDVSRDKKKISKYIYGVNIANWCPTYYLDLCTPKLKKANVSVVRLGATNMERYNYKMNRMFNAISRENEYVPMSWKSFVRWCKNKIKAEPFLQVSVYGHVADSGNTLEDSDYDDKQSLDEVKSWISEAGESVKFWGIGNEPWIAWKRPDYPDPYTDNAHGDQVLNKDTSYDNHFGRFLSLAYGIKRANPKATIFGPTPANWWLYWTNEYSPLCPVTEPNGDAQADAPAWKAMSVNENQWNKNIFPDRGDNPNVTGWETNQNRNLSQYLIRAKEREEREGVRVVDYMDVHRYMRMKTEKDAIQETRGLLQEGFESRDLEVVWDLGTSSSGIETKLLKRFQNMVDTYYPDTNLSFSEYDYFYWSGYPKLAQVAAVGQMDFLGFFARMGVKLACNWYVGEPNQAGISGEKGSDSKKQAMFDEKGIPSPKYWAFLLMSRYFRGSVVYAESSDWDKFSVHACKYSKDIIVFAAYKGIYDQDSGDYISDQAARTAQIQINGLKGNAMKKLRIKEIHRFGLNDPHIVQMETSGIDVVDGTFTYEFQPLSIYTFVLSKEGLQKQPERCLIVTPKRIDFGPYETGIAENDGKNLYTIPVKITNARQKMTTWSISKNASWLNIVGDTSGEAKVTDMVYLTVDRTGLSYGNYETTVVVTTSEGSKKIPVTVEIARGEADGVKRICDFETGSLAHSRNKIEPYSVGWWDAHGTSDDRDNPYVYRFFLDQKEKPDMGGQASMRIEFDRSNGDTEDAKRYMTFGTYGHKITITGEDGIETTYDATANWTGYAAFEFDVKTNTKNRTTTEFLIVISDEIGNKGKPAVGIESYNGLIELVNGDWQTVTIPLDGTFYDWRYPEGQNGSMTQLDFSRISQIEFAPCIGTNDTSGTIYLDNLRLIKTSNDGTSTAM